LEASDTNDTTRITVVDLVAGSMGECLVRSLDKTDGAECPANKINPFGEQLALLSLGMFLGLGALGVCATYSPGRFLFWTALLTFWSADCSVGFFSAMYGQIQHPTGGMNYFLRAPNLVVNNVVDKFLVSLMYNVVLFDVPMFGLKLLANFQFCFPPGVFNLLYIVFVTSFGVVCSNQAIRWAYTPATIIVVGHHPLLMGLGTFLLQFPKKIAMNSIKKYIKESILGMEPEKYTGLFTELSWFFQQIAEPLPGQLLGRPGM